MKKTIQRHNCALLSLSLTLYQNLVCFHAFFRPSVRHAVQESRSWSLSDVSLQQVGRRVSCCPAARTQQAIMKSNHWGRSRAPLNKRANQIRLSEVVASVQSKLTCHTGCSEKSVATQGQRMGGFQCYYCWNPLSIYKWCYYGTWSLVSGGQCCFFLLL